MFENSNLQLLICLWKKEIVKVKSSRKPARSNIFQRRALGRDWMHKWTCCRLKQMFWKFNSDSLMPLQVPLTTWDECSSPHTWACAKIMVRFLSSQTYFKSQIPQPTETCNSVAIPESLRSALVVAASLWQQKLDIRNLKSDRNSAAEQWHTPDLANALSSDQD